MPLSQRTEPYPHWEFSAPWGDRLRIVPERGGLVTGWRCGGRERLYFDAERFADPAASVRGGIPVLFPICGNLPGDRLELPQGSFLLRQHGFARDLPWQLEPLEAAAAGTAAGIRLRLEDSPATRASFPFAFRLDLELRLEPGALAITARISHREGTAPADGGTTPATAMPFSFGLHPYLAVSALEAVELEGLPDTCFDHHPMAPAATATQLERLAQGVDLLSAPSGPVRLWDRGAGSGLELQTTAPFDLVVVWTDPPRPMLCLEPWTAPRGSLVTGERRLELAPGASQELHCRYRVLDDA